MKLLLNGGGSTKELKLTMDKLNKIMDHSKPILYVPLAMEETEHPYDSCYEWFQKQIENVDVPNVDMPRTFEEFALKNFNNYSAIFIGGGNTYKLLKGIKDNGIFNKIIEYLNKNGIVIGCSAGAIIFGYDIDSCLSMDKNDVNLVDTKGFDFLKGKSIFAHYTNSETEEIHKKYTDYLKNYSINNEQVIALPEEDTIFINDEKIEILGNRPYYEFRKGLITMHNTIQLVPYTDEYYDFVYEVKKNAYKKYVEECWKKWDEEAQREYFKKFIETYKNSAYIIKLDNEDVGFYNDEELEDGSYEVGNICIKSEFQGKGFGTMILKNKLEEHKNQDIIIQFFKQNPVEKLYKRLGFVPNGETEFHYQMIKRKDRKYKDKTIMDKITIVNLANDIKFLEEASMYMWKEWAEQYGTKYEDIIYRTKHCLNKDSIPQTYIARYNDELVGFVSIWNNDLPFRQDLFPWLAGLYVKEEYRGIGIGNLLQKKCIEVVKELGYTKLYLITEHKNYYEKTGWKFIEEAPLRGGIYTRLYEFEIK